MKKKFREFDNDIIELEPDSITVGKLIEKLKKYDLNNKIYQIISKNDKTGYVVGKPIMDNESLDEIFDNIFIIQ